MATPSPICEVKDGSGSYQSTTGGVNVTPGNTVTIRLASTAGVDVWSIQCVSTDETSTAPTLTVNYTNKTATFTAPAAGKALRFKSTVKSQSDKLTSSATFGIYTLTDGGYRVVAYQETTEGNADFGWTDRLNSCIRGIGGARAICGAYSTRPAAPAEGTEFLPTDGGSRWVYTGGIWRPIFPGAVGYEPPEVGSWTALDGGSGAVISKANGVFELATTLCYSLTKIGLAVMALPGGAYTVTARLTPFAVPLNNGGGAATFASGLVLRNSSSGAFEWFVMVGSNDNLQRLQVNRYNSQTSYNTSLYAQVIAPHLVGTDYWLRVTDNGSTRTYYYSNDGVRFVYIADWSGGTRWADPADQIGLGHQMFLGAGQSYDSGIRCSSWEIR